MLRIVEVLKKKGISQAQAARMSGVGESSFSRICRGIEPAYPHRGERIAEALGWQGDPADLFREVEEAE